MSPWAVRLRDDQGARPDTLALSLSARGATWRIAERDLPLPAGGGMLIDLAHSAGASCDGDLDLLLLAPRRLLPTMGAARIVAEPVARSAALPSLRHLATALLHMEGALTEAQADLAGSALAESMAASLAAQRTAGGGLAPRREASPARRLSPALRSGRVASVSSIAWRCGFGDLSRFGRRFRETFQASPSDLRHFRRGRLPIWAGAYHVEKNYRGMIAA